MESWTAGTGANVGETAGTGHEVSSGPPRCDSIWRSCHLAGQQRQMGAPGITETVSGPVPRWCAEPMNNCCAPYSENPALPIWPSTCCARSTGSAIADRIDMAVMVVNHILIANRHSAFHDHRGRTANIVTGEDHLGGASPPFQVAPPTAAVAASAKVLERIGKAPRKARPPI